MDARGNQLWGPVFVCHQALHQRAPLLVPYGSGGAIVAWRDERSAQAFSVDLYGQRLDSTGTPWWQDGGVLLAMR